MQVTNVLGDELWYSHDYLHDGVHITTAAEVMYSSEARTMKGLQLATALL